MGSNRARHMDIEKVISIDDYDTSKAKQRASVSWIVQKAHKNKVPSDLQDPYYKDYEGQEHLKPNIVHRLANADFYCSALANIYGDPNFHNLSHWNIIQALARKGVYVAEPTDVALTETVLIQVSPIKMSAHLAVIEAMMALYIREVVIAERVVKAVQRISGFSVNQNSATPQDQEDALVFWVDHVTQALQTRIHQQSSPSQDQDFPVFPKIQDLSDLSDGIGLAALISYYCPQELMWTDIAVTDPPSMADSLYNIGLVIKFCNESLPYNPCLLTKEDVVYMHSSVKQNILAFVAELFFLLELEPVSCVSVPSTRKSSKYIQLPSGMKPAGVPSVRRSHSMNLSDVGESRPRADSRSEHAPSSYNSDYGGRDSSLSDSQEGEFVVQKSRGVATLGDIMRIQSPRPSIDASDFFGSRGVGKERYSVDSREEDMGERGRISRQGSFHGSMQDLPAAGLPSQMEARPRGRSRSRRNSVSVEDSQLTIENFGGSQENLNYIGRNPDKEIYVHTGRKESTASREGSLPRELSGDRRRSTSQTRERSTERRFDLLHPSTDECDNRVTGKLEREALDKEEKERKNVYYSKRKESPRTEYVRLEQEKADTDSEADSFHDQEKPISKATSFAELSKIKDQLPGGINIIYMHTVKEDNIPKSYSKNADKKTTFAALPNQTTWKQQSAQCMGEENKAVPEDNMEPQVMSSEIHNVRLKLEEKRRRIENEKKRMEVAASRQRQKLGKEAFMQAVVKSDVGAEVSSVSRKWLNDGTQEELRTPDIEAMDYDEYQRSLTHRDSLHGLPPYPKRHQRSLEYHGIPSSSYYGNPRPDLRRFSLCVEPGSWHGDYHPSCGSRLNPYSFYPPLPYHRRSSFAVTNSELTQPSPSRMTDSLTEIQSDIQRLTQQQQQIQSLMHNGMVPNPQQSLQQPLQNQFYLHDQVGSPRRMWGHQSSSDGYASMSPATRRAQWGPVSRPMMPQPDFMMGGGQIPVGHPQSVYNAPYTMPVQPHQLPPLTHLPPHGGQSFVLHGQPQSLPPDSQRGFYQNGQGCYGDQLRGFPTLSANLSTYPTGDSQRQGPSHAPFRLHDGSSGGEESRGPGSLHSSAHSSPSRLMLGRQKSPSPSCQTGKSQVSHSAVAAPPADCMEPQSVYFIESQEQNSHELPEAEDLNKLKRLSITSGSRTYRISHEPGSPTRPSLGTKTFRVPTKKGMPVHDDADLPQPNINRSLSPSYGEVNNITEKDKIKTEPLIEGNKAEKGFYISFDDDDTPKKPKPNLRTKRLSLRKSSTPTTPVTTPNKEEPPSVLTSLRGQQCSSIASQRSSLSLSLTSPLSSPATPSVSRYTSPFASSCLSPTSPSVLPVITGGRRSFLDRVSEPAVMRREPNGNVLNDDLEQANTLIKKKGDSTALVIGEDLIGKEDSALSEMEKKKERLMIMSMRRKQQQEEMKRKKELEAEMRQDEEKRKEDERLRKKEEDRARRELILERHKIKKAIEEAEKEGRYYQPPAWYLEETMGVNLSKSSSVKLRNKPAISRPRPKTMHDVGATLPNSFSPRVASKESTQYLASGVRGPGASSTLRKSNGRWGSSHGLSRAAGSRGSTGSLGPDYLGSSMSRTLDRGHTGRRPTSVIGTSSFMKRNSSKSSLYASRGADLNESEFHVHEARHPALAIEGSRGSLRRPSAPQRYDSSLTSPRKYRSTGNLYGQSEHDSLQYHMSEDSGLGRATPPRRAPSPGMASRHLPSPCGPGSLPPGLFSKRRPGFDDAASDISSNTSSTMDYSGPRLFRQPTAKSNRSIILNAVEYCVFPGVVNQNAKQRVLEEVARSESKHFLILFRDSGCQFRALYSYSPETEEVYKLYGTGPKQVIDKMFDKFFKYNSGGKCFTQIHTKHLTVTIDAFTIHSSLWQGKKVNLPPKKDMTLVI